MSQKFRQHSEVEMQTVKEEKVGNTTLRLVAKAHGFVGLLIAGAAVKAQIDGNDAEAIWAQLLARAGEASPSYFGYDGARARFLKHFPGGFGSSAYAARERDYKLQAKAKLDAALPLTEAIDGSGMGAAALAAIEATNLLSVFEKAKLSPLLKGSDADAFIRAAAQFTLGDHSAGLAAMERAACKYDSAKWTVVTYLPFLWDPHSHIYLKPQVTQDYAIRVGHRFAHEYTPVLDADVYESLLDLAAQTRTRTTDLKPQDNVDIQSFIWIIGAYDEVHSGT